MPTYKVRTLTYDRNEEVPRDVEDSKSEPLGPHAEQKEEEGKAHGDCQVERLLRASSFDHEHEQTTGAHELVTRWRELDQLGSLGFLVADHILFGVRQNALDSLGNHHHCAKHNAVLNFLEVVEREGLGRLGNQLEHFLSIHEKRVVEVAAYCYDSLTYR